VVAKEETIGRRGNSWEDGLLKREMGGKIRKMGGYVRETGGLVKEAGGYVRETGGLAREADWYVSVDVDISGY
jgi:hypothetical protein